VAHNTPGAESLESAEKSQQCCKYFFQYSTFTRKRPYVRTRGCQTCFLPRAPSNLGTPVHKQFIHLLLIQALSNFWFQCYPPVKKFAQSCS